MDQLNISRLLDKAFYWLGLCCTFFGLLVLVIFVGKIMWDGLGRIDWNFLTQLPSRKAEKAGILTAWVGTLWVISFTAFISVPLGIAAGVYLEEYTKKNKFMAIIEVNIANLAGVPSIVYGLLGLEIFGRLLNMGSSILAAAFTLALLILPILIVATREALRSVSNTIREASYAMGATQWQTLSHQVLPVAMGGIMTGIILSLSRALGETAPLIVVGALAYVPFLPMSPMDGFTVLPMQIFNWVSRPQQSFLVNGASAIIILLFITFILNGVAIYLRYRWQKRIRE